MAASLLLLLSRFSRVRLCDPTDGSPPGSSIPGILQARVLEWGAIAFSGGSITARYYCTITVYYSITIESAPFKPGQVLLSIVSPPSSRHSALPLRSLTACSHGQALSKLLTYSLMHSKILWGGDKHKGVPCSEVRLSPNESQTKDLVSDSDSQNRTEKWSQRGENGPTARVTGLRAPRLVCRRLQSKKQGELRKDPASQDNITEEHSSWEDCKAVKPLMPAVFSAGWEGWPWCSGKCALKMSSEEGIVSHIWYSEIPLEKYPVVAFL